eukprot:CAMPEP_0170261634 /NCGR_PEP_ID=MMETSP0116_2-20130129/30698_1 /TAXON_ID=400756 /ORGANISM="Durinskia baltica, Strain CSIRO CS-38" /LENGTH=145 /DNA_ID=CAMNT_0010512699 /DNA_START=219 /DNA_END=657 /DNA_ORIENTATION=-
MSTVHDDMAVFPPLCGKFRCMLQLRRRRRDAIPTSNEQVRIVTNAFASLWELASQVDDAPPRFPQLVPITSADPPAGDHFIGHRDAFDPVLPPLESSVQPCGDMEPGEQHDDQAGTCPVASSLPRMTMPLSVKKSTAMSPFKPVM